MADPAATPSSTINNADGTKTSVYLDAAPAAKPTLLEFRRLQRLALTHCTACKPPRRIPPQDRGEHNRRKHPELAQRVAKLKSQLDARQARADPARDAP